MKANRLVLGVVALVLAVAGVTYKIKAESSTVGTSKIKHVLLLSIDGMHAVDFYNCSRGIAGVNGGEPYCPNLAALTKTGINYVGAQSSRPSDSFPGITALVSGGTPKSTGIYYDVAYDRSLDPPTITTGTGLAGGSCNAGKAPSGTTTDYDQGIELNDTAFSNIASPTTLAASNSTITFVQSTYTDPQASETSVEVAYPSAQTAGDLNIVVIGWNDTTAIIKSVTDSMGNTSRWQSA
jgi:hypothetical protein